MNSEESIHSWIKGTLSSRQAFLGNLPPCPYATDAVVRGQVKIFDSSAASAFVDVDRKLSTFFSDKCRVSVVAIKDWEHLSVEDTSRFVRHCREKFYQQDLWLLYDHPQITEVVQDFSFNHGSLLLFLVQRLSDLVQTGFDLQKTDYYKKWPKDYFNDVVRLREVYYQRYLAHKGPELLAAEK